MKTVTFIQVLYIIINFEANNFIVNGAEKCESSIETRAVLLSCPEKDTGCEDDDPLSKATLADEYRLLQVKPSEMKKLKATIEREFPNRVTECKRKLVITMKLNNKGKIDCDDGFIVIDHVYDPFTRGKARLLSPVVIKLRQEQMVQLYPLQFQKIVNSNPNENVCTKDTCSSYKGCSTDLDNPTCGITTYNGEQIPFSEGFCCSRDPYVNAMREVLPDIHEDASQYKDPSLFGHKKNHETRSKAKASVIINPHLLNLKAENRKIVRRTLITDQEQAQSSRAQNILETPPNFFFERDRQYVCNPDSLLQQLYDLRNKNTEDDTKDEEETDEDECNNGESVPTENPSKDNENPNNCSSDCRDTTQETACSGNRKSNQGRFENGNLNISNCETSTKICKNSALSDNEQEKNSLKDMNGYLDIVDSDSGGQYQFTGNSFIPRQMKNKKDEMKMIEILHGKRDIENPDSTRRRKKRLTLDNEEYNLLLQNNQRRSRRIFGTRKIPKSKASCKETKTQSSNKGKTASSKLNCTLPNYFFSHDKSIICPQSPENNTCILEEFVPDEYLDTKEKSASHTPQLKQSASKQDAPLRLITKKGGIWNVNSKIQNGNMYRLDLVKLGNFEDEIEKTHKISFENKKFPMTFSDFPVGKHIYQDNPDTIAGRYKIGSYVLNQKLKNLERPQEFKKAPQYQYRSENNVGYSPGSRRNHPAMKGEMEIIFPTRGNEYHKIDLTSAEIERMRKTDKQSLQNLLQNVAEKAQSEDIMSQKAYEAIQDESRGLRFDDNREINHENMWKSYNSYGKESPKWVDKIREGRYLNERDVDDLLSDNYAGNKELENDILLNRKNVFFSGSKPEHIIKRKNTMRYNDDIDELRQREQQESMKKRNDVASDDSRDSPFYKSNEKLSNYDWTQPFMSETSFNEEMRKRKWNEQDSYKGFQKLRNAQFVRNRKKRSTVEMESQEPHVKISKWERRTPPGPEYQFDVSTLTRIKADKSHFHSSDRLGLRDMQKMKPRGTHNKDGKELRKDLKMKIDRERLKQSYLTSPRKLKREVRNDRKGKRHAETMKRQEGEGETFDNLNGETTTNTNCEDLDTKYESSHCMKLSDLWYSVYLIKRPVLAQLVGVQIYDKRTRCDGTMNWRDLTKGYMVRLGSFLQTAEDEIPTISMTYTPVTTELSKDEPKLDTENQRLLIPSHLTNEKKSKFYPEFYGGPAEFLVVNRNEISSSGADCNKIGASFEALARQPDRCNKPPGDCLKSQPVDLWREDMEARIRGKRGKYFIENFGNVSNSSIKSYSNLTGDYLAMDYFGEYSSILEIEMRADGNAIIRQGENAQISQVYIDSVSERRTKIFLSVINMGLTTSLFRPRLGECPSNLDPTWCPLEGPLVQIPPQQRHDFKLELTGALPSKKLHCAVEVLNHYNKKVATRRIVIRRADRCFCVFYCKCICIDSSKNHVCTRLKREEFNAAGYFEPLPRRSIPSVSESETFLNHLKLALVSMFMTILALGLIKAILGIFVRKLGIFGVQIIVGPRTLCQYYEPELYNCQVIYDECGFPIHPQTCREVQIVPLWLQLFINIFFFYLYFLKFLWLLISSIPCCKLIIADMKCRARRDCATSGVNIAGNYPQNYFAYNVMTFTSKKKKEPERNALCNLYKTDEDPLEEDDTDFVLEEIQRYKNKN